MKVFLFIVVAIAAVYVTLLAMTWGYTKELSLPKRLAFAPMAVFMVIDVIIYAITGELVDNMFFEE